MPTLESSTAPAMHAHPLRYLTVKMAETPADDVAQNICKRLQEVNALDVVADCVSTLGVGCCEALCDEALRLHTAIETTLTPDERKLAFKQVCGCFAVQLHDVSLQNSPERKAAGGIFLKLAKDVPTPLRPSIRPYTPVPEPRV